MTVTPGREALARLTPADRGLIKKIKNHLSTVEYRSSSATYIHGLLAIIERLAANPSSDPDAMNERRVEEDARLAANVREAVEHIEMAQSRLRAAMMGDEPCKPCIDLAASYLQEATKAFGSTTGEPKR